MHWTKTPKGRKHMERIQKLSLKARRRKARKLAEAEWASQHSDEPIDPPRRESIDIASYCLGRIEMLLDSYGENSEGLRHMVGRFLVNGHNGRP